MKKYVIGVDLGGTKITTAISDLTGDIIEKTTLATGSALGEEVVMGRIFDSIAMVLEASGIHEDEVRAIGIGAPGPLDAEKPWADEGIAGCEKFLRRVWLHFVDEQTGLKANLRTSDLS